MAYADDLATARDNLALAIKVQTANWTALGCPPTVSIDGESYDWNSWYTQSIAGLKALSELIATDDPYEHVTTAYTD